MTPLIIRPLRRRLVAAGTVLSSAAALLVFTTSASAVASSASRVGAAPSTVRAQASTDAGDPPAGTVVVNENFDGLTSLPAGWTAQTSGWSVSNGVLNQTSTDDVRVITFGPHVNNFKFEGDLTFTGNGSGGQWAGFGMNVEGAAPSWQIGIKRHGTDPSTLDFSYHSDGGWVSGLAQVATPFSLANGQPVHVELDVWGNHGELSVNGQKMTSYDSVGRTPDGTFGLLMGAGATGTFDNIKVTTLSGFNTDSFTTGPVLPGGQVQQDVSSLWNGPTPPTGFTKVGGDPWLSVSPDGTVSGTAPSPAPDHPGTITVQATDGSSTSRITVQVPVGLFGHFATSDFTIPAVPAGAPVRQVVSGLWEGNKPAGYTKVSGDGWLSVSPDGVVTGTAPSPAPKNPGVIAISNGSASPLTIEVPVLARGDRPQITAASWNLWDNGSHVDDALGKELTAITGSGLDVIGVQESGGSGAQALADALGWHVYQSSGDLGIVSAYPINAVTAPTANTPAAGVTLNVDANQVRVWAAHLDEADYGPDRAAAGATDLVAHEKTTLRYQQANEIAKEIAPDLAHVGTTPVILLGDLASPSGTDSSVDWPVPDVFAHAGLTDSMRAVYPRPADNPGYTYNLLDTKGASNRIDYVDYAGPLQPLDAEALYRGSPQPDTSANTWVSNHAAAVTLFQMKPAR